MIDESQLVAVADGFGPGTARGGTIANCFFYSTAAGTLSVEVKHQSFSSISAWSQTAEGGGQDTSGPWTAGVVNQYVGVNGSSVEFLVGHVGVVVNSSALDEQDVLEIAKIVAANFSGATSATGGTD